MLVQKRCFGEESDFSATLFSIFVSDVEIEEEFNMRINPREIWEPGLAGENSELLVGGNGVKLSFASHRRV